MTQPDYIMMVCSVCGSNQGLALCIDPPPDMKPCEECEKEYRRLKWAMDRYNHEKMAGKATMDILPIIRDCCGIDMTSPSACNECRIDHEGLKE